MASEKQCFIAYADAVVRQYKEVNGLIALGLANEIPQAVGIELQHMLMHLVAVKKYSSSDYFPKIHQLANALGHADRAYLDGCKILIDKKFNELQTKLSFMQDWTNVRQSELSSHSRPVIPDSNGVPMPASTNPVCARFKKLLIDHGLMPAPQIGPATIPEPSTENTWQCWKDFLPEVECWLKLDLFYNTLLNQKHHGALQGLLLYFMDMDRKRLKQLNLQLMFDTLVKGGHKAHTLGWEDYSLQKEHRAFITTYTSGPWQEQDLTAEKDWINPLFESLWKFYTRS